MPRLSSRLITLWYLLAIAVGLYFARSQGASPEALLLAGGTAILVICGTALMTVQLKRTSL
jgi:hypothetical protein